MASQRLAGKYRFQSSDGVDEYLKGLGVGLVLRKVQSVARPTIDISYQAELNQWTILSESVFKTKKVTFKPLEKFDDETFDSRKCKTSVEIIEEGKIMVLTQTCDEGPEVQTTITANEDGFTMTMKSGGLTCELKYNGPYEG